MNNAATRNQGTFFLVNHENKKTGFDDDVEKEKHLLFN